MGDMLKDFCFVMFGVRLVIGIEFALLYDTYMIVSFSSFVYGYLVRFWWCKKVKKEIKKLEDRSHGWERHKDMNINDSVTCSVLHFLMFDSSRRKLLLR